MYYTVGILDTYQDFDSDCKKSGKAAAKIELTTWKVCYRKKEKGVKK